MKMMLPFPEWILNTPVKVYIESEGEDGPNEVLIFDGMCNYDERGRNVLTAKKEMVTLSGTCILKGDIYPNQKIDGYVEIHGQKRQIFRSLRPKNPNGSVFSTELQLG